MNGVIIACAACGRKWPFGSNVGEYERLSLEAVPCPGCGAHTLHCVATKAPRVTRPHRQMVRPGQKSA